MGYSPTSSPTRARNHDVFLSFRGVDTRNNIVSHLHKALVDGGVCTFKDDKNLEAGDTISEELVNAIQTSWFAVVVLSENYATSSWCLEELRQIMELSNEKRIKVVPIFYRVEPSNVKYQKGSFEAAFQLKRYTDPEKVLKWKGALFQVGNLSGKHVKKCDDEAEMIAELVSSISARLQNMKPIHVISLVGMEAHMEKMKLLLNKEPKSEVGMIGILGMVGIGKTAIAKHLYNKFSHEFSVHCFIKNAWKFDDPNHLQRELLSRILRSDEHIKLLSWEAAARKIKDILGHKKVFLVIDGVDKAEQVHALAKESSWFGPGSRIIITTRDRGLLNACGVNNVHEVKCLNDKDALQVFKELAFAGRPPPFQGSEKLFIRASRLAHGLPIALVAFALHLSEKTTVEEWEGELYLLETRPQKNVAEILRASYDGLDPYDKIVFLQVACLFNGSLVWLIRVFLGKSGPRIYSLVAKSLLDISNDGRLIMHFLVEQTGREIVRQDSRSKQKFLWEPDEIYHVLAKKIGPNEIKGVSLHMCEMSNTLHVRSSVFMPMDDLTFLRLLKHAVDTVSKLQLVSHVSGITHSQMKEFTHSLKLLHWDAYPLVTLPPSFRSSTLVELSLRHSNLKRFWDEPDESMLYSNLNQFWDELGVYGSVVYKPKVFPNLRKLDVTGSKNLVQLPDLSQSVNLEELIMEGCRSLKQFPGTIDKLHVRKLNILRCDGLGGVMQVSYHDLTEACPYRGIYLLVLDKVVAGLSSLRDVSIQGEIDIALLHALTGTAERLFFTCEQQIPNELVMTLEQKTGKTQALHLFKTLVIERFNYRGISDSFTCHSFASFPCLTELKLINLNIREIPQDIGCLLSLTTIDFTGNDFVHLPETMAQLTKLQSITLRSCRYLKALPVLALPGVDNNKTSRGLLVLCIDNCKNLQSLRDELLCYYTSLAYLDLSNHGFERIPTSIRKLSSLTTLCLNNCKKLKSVEELPLSLNHLYARGCDSLQSVTVSPNHSIKHVDLRDCPHLKKDEQVSARFSTVSRL